jgi:hypothetical protein
LVLAGQAAEATPVATDQILYSAQLLLPAAVVAAEPGKTVVLVVAQGFTICPVEPEIRQAFRRRKATMAEAIAAPATEQVAVVVVPQQQDRLLVLSMTMPAMAARVRHLLFLAHL